MLSTPTCTREFYETNMRKNHHQNTEKEQKILGNFLYLIQDRVGQTHQNPQLPALQMWHYWQQQ